jgi:hypothetical protein
LPVRQHAGVQAVRHRQHLVVRASGSTTAEEASGVRAKRRIHGRLAQPVGGWLLCGIRPPSGASGKTSRTSATLTMCLSLMRLMMV